MADEGGQVVEGRRIGKGPPDTTVPTGSYLTSEGSSVELDADLATAEEIPSTEEILEKRTKPRRKPRPAPEEKPARPFVPHDKGRP